MILKQKRLFYFIVVILLLLLQTPALAAEEAIPSIVIDVTLRGDGSAIVTEIWDVRGAYDGTEYYKGLYNMEGMSVHSLFVWDESGTEYETVDGWDTGHSIEEKAATCGILETSDGYELCWGIGSYGDHQYTIRYTLEGLVKNYGDYAGFYHRFISEMSSAPESVAVTIRVQDEALTADNARIWGYGFSGEVQIQSDGCLAAFTAEALGGNDYVNVLCRFDNGLFPAASAAGETFESLQESAENENSDTALYIFLAVLAGLIVVLIILLAFFLSRYKLADGTVVRLPGDKRIEANWTVPFGGSIPGVHTAMKLLRRGGSIENLMSAYLVRMQEAGSLSIEELDEDPFDKTGGKEEAIVLNLEKQPEKGSEQALYKLLLSFAGSGGVLRSSVLEERGEKFHERLTKWEENVENEGEKELTKAGLIKNDAKGKARFTAPGFEQAVRMLGFRKHLLAFRKPTEDYMAPRELWGDYLVFSALFGIDGRILEGMKALDPAYFETFSGAYGCNAYSMMYFMSMTDNISSAPSSNIDGTGGDAGSSGGGGFSGGGGGGSR